MEQKRPWFDAYRFAGRNAKVFWDRNGGKICTIAGTGGMILFGAHACRRTYRMHDKLKERGAYIDKQKQLHANEKPLKRFAKDAATYLLEGLGTAINYSPDLIGGALSAYCIRKGWKIEHANYQKATAMVGIIAGSFMNYRKNVIAEHGKDADRRYLTTKHEDRKVREATLEDGTKITGNGKDDAAGQGIVVDLDPNLLRIWYSKETTPQVWSPSHTIRMGHLESITNKLTTMLRCGGHYNINDVRGEFYGLKGDLPEGGLFGRIWDPGDPAHPERGALVNLHYEDDEDFKYGLTDSCWIIIDIDDEPLTESLKAKKLRDHGPYGLFTAVEV